MRTRRSPPVRLLAAPAAVLLLVLLVLPAAAQVPTMAAVSVEGPASGSVSLDEAGAFTFTVTNDSPGSDTPLDDQNAARVTVAVADVPAGWTAAVSPADFRLTPGASQSVVLSVSVSADAGAAEAVLRVVATLTTPLEGLGPVLGQAGASQTATGEAAITIERTDSATRTLLESVSYGIYLILLALLAAVVIATKLILDNRRVTVALHSKRREASVLPGGRVALPLEVRNIGKHDDTVVFQVSSLPDGWAAFLPVVELELQRSAAEQMHLVAIAPAGAKAGDRQEILVTAHSAQGPRHPASLTFTVAVEGNAPAGKAPAKQAAKKPAKKRS